MKRFQSFMKGLFYMLLLFVVVAMVTSVNEKDPVKNAITASIITACAVVLIMTTKRKKKDPNVYTAEFIEGICEKIQTSMLETFGTLAPELRRSQVGYTQAVSSAENKAGVKTIPLDPGNGKNKSVRIVGLARGCDDEWSDDITDDCSTETEIEPWEDTVTITEHIASKAMKFDETEMRKLCEADSEWIARVVNSRIDPMMVELNKRLITKQNNNFGVFPGTASNAAKSIDMLANTTQGLAPVIEGEMEILNDAEDADLTGRPLVIGAGRLRNYMRLAKMGCCNSFGTDYSQSGKLGYYYDRNVEGIIGANEFIALQPGHVQLVTWNKYVGPYMKENQVFSHTTILDPFTNIKLDMKWHYNDCNDTYSLQFFLYYLLYFMPNKAFNYCDRLYNYNGTLNYLANQI